MSSFLRPIALTASLLLPAFAFTAQAQNQAPPASQSSDASTQDNDTPAGAYDPGHATPEDDTRQAWSILTDAAADKHSLVRVQALAALGNIGDARSAKLILDAMDDPDLDVRTAAALAAGTSHQPSLVARMHGLLDDKEPQVAFAAATTLWKLKDHSGEDILMAVAAGDRKADATFVNGTMHTMNKDFHNPSTIARVGALQGASLLLGPFGFGITAYEAMRRNGGSSARVGAIEQLSQDHSDVIRRQLMGALGDKDLTVRAAAAKALGDFRQPDVASALANLFIDPKPPVRYTAAAAYLHVTQPLPAATPAPSSEAKPATPKTSTKKKPAAKP